MSLQARFCTCWYCSRSFSKISVSLAWKTLSHVEKTGKLGKVPIVFTNSPKLACLPAVVPTIYDWSFPQCPRRLDDPKSSSTAYLRWTEVHSCEDTSLEEKSCLNYPILGLTEFSWATLVTSFGCFSSNRWKINRNKKFSQTPHKLGFVLLSSWCFVKGRKARQKVFMQPFLTERFTSYFERTVLPKESFHGVQTSVRAVFPRLLAPVFKNSECFIYDNFFVVNRALFRNQRHLPQFFNGCRRPRRLRKDVRLMAI